MFNNFSKSKEAKTGDVVVLKRSDRVPSTPDAGVIAFQPEDPKLTQWLDLKTRLHEALLERLNLSVIEKVESEDLRREVAVAVGAWLKESGEALNGADFNRLIDELLHELLGFGPLEPLLADPTVNDILVNGYRKVFVERFGVLEKAPVRFRDEKHLLRIIDKIVSRVGRRVDGRTLLRTTLRHNRVSIQYTFVGTSHVDGGIEPALRYARGGVDREALPDRDGIPRK